MERRTFLKNSGLIAFASASASLVTPALAQEQADLEPSLRITWLGSATMLISCMGLTILTDPCFGEGDTAFVMGDPNEMFDLSKGPTAKAHRRTTPFGGIDLDAVDHMVLSHMHKDHFDQAAEAVLPRNMSTIVPPDDAGTLAGKGFGNADSMDWGARRTIHKGKVFLTITPVRADHSERPQIAELLGKGNGYWMEFVSGDWKKSIYWTGDTFPTEGVREAVKPFGRPDILIPHMGGVGQTGALGQISMGADHVMSLIEATKPGKVLPIHHSTYEFYLDPIHELASAMPANRAGLDLVSEGTALVYT
ncbi:MAG: MBL fold metallo-hydrolase [Labrenzia sp.]